MRASAILLMTPAGLAAAAVAVAQPAPKHRKAVAEEAPVAPPPRGVVLVAAGASAGLDRAMGPLPSARMSFYLPDGFTLSAIGAAKQLGAERASSTAVLVGYRRAVERGRLAAWAGLEAGGGIAMSGPTTGAMTDAPMALVVPHVGASVQASRQVALGIELSLPEALVHQGGAFTLQALPAAWLGALFDL